MAGEPVRVLTPLNGTKTHSLSVLAQGTLRRIQTTLVPCQEINPGVVNRLLQTGLVEIVSAPSPYRMHKGRPIPHLANRPVCTEISHAE